jgi:hypothetical protein
MTSQQSADLALSLFQANRKSPEIEALLDAFFSFPTREEYDRTLSRVSECMSCPETTGSRFQSPSSGAL